MLQSSFMSSSREEMENIPAILSPINIERSTCTRGFIAQVPSCNVVTVRESELWFAIVSQLKGHEHEYRSEKVYKSRSTIASASSVE